MKPYYEGEGLTIYHGDCREVLSDLPLVDLVLTDPPYALGGGRAEWRVTASVGAGLHYAAKRVRKGGALLCFTTSSARGIEYTLGAVGDALPFNRVLVWHKQSQRSRVAGPWLWDAVCVLAFGRATFGSPQASSVYSSSGVTPKESEHPAEVPYGVAEWLYDPFDASVVLDPFMGSGSLLLPALRTGKRAIGIEANEEHCERMAQRFQQQHFEVAAA